LQPSHGDFILTSTKYSSESKICELAHGYNKFIKMENGDEYIHSPFLPSDEATDKIGQFGTQNSFNNISKFL
jgi:hypothetical protein